MIFFGAILSVAAEKVLVRGIVTDSISGERIPYATVTLDNGRGTAVADSSGIFDILTPSTASAITARSQGYKARKLRLWTNSFNIYEFRLAPQTTELGELVVKKKRYSKKNNPAVELVRRLSADRARTDPEREEWYSYDAYERIALGLNNFDDTWKRALRRQFPFLEEYADTSEFTGLPVLCLAINEQSRRRSKTPEGDRTDVTGSRQRGMTEIGDKGNMTGMLTEVLREVDVYDNNIHLMHNSFVSPLSPLAPDFYRFYITDTVTVAGDSCSVLSFYPRNAASMGFVGQLYIAANDSGLFLHRATMHTPRDINLNWVEAMQIDRSYERGPNGRRLCTADALDAVMSPLPGLPSIYVSRNVYYSNYSIGADSVSGTADIDSLAAGRARPAESRLDEMMARMRSVKLYYYGERFLRRMVQGYWPAGPYFDFGPINTLASYNTLEGLRLRGGGMTTSRLSAHLFGRGYVAYGFKDHKWKGSAELEYSFKAKERHAREFPVHSIAAGYTYDVDRIGSHYLYTNPDNFVLSLARSKVCTDTYLGAARLRYTLEFENNFSVEATLSHQRQYPSRYVQFLTGNGSVLPHFDQACLDVQLRYAPGEKFYQGRNYRIPLNYDAPTVVLTHRFSPGGFMGSRYSVNRTEIDFGKRFWLSVAGSIDVFAGAGHVWGSAPYTQLFIPNANLSYTIQPRSFALMQPMEFVNSSYVSWELTYRARGLLFNLIPGVKKLGLREVIGFRGLYGHLDRRCTPGEERPALILFPAEAMARPMDDGPYMELSAGIENILRIFRVEYVWRLSYRYPAGEVDRGGVRFAAKFTF